jgi:hypothetical protein
MTWAEVFLPVARLDEYFHEGTELTKLFLDLSGTADPLPKII